MNINIYLIMIAAGLGLGLLVIPHCLGKKKFEFIPRIQKISDIPALFPMSVTEINKHVDGTILQAKERLQTLIAVPANERSFDNTARALDDISSGFSITGAALVSLAYLSPDEALRTAANEGSLKMNEFAVDWLGQNVELYKAFKEYVEGNAVHEPLNAEERYFITETFKNFKKSGLELPEAQREQIKKLQKELAALSIKFDDNINTDNRSIAVTRDELVGLPEDFINHLKKNDEGNSILGVDYPTYFTVIQNAQVEETRKKLFQEFNNRAYPANEQVLKDIVHKRDELAKLLGFSSYAALDTDDEMVQTPERAAAFLKELIAKSDKKEAKEFALLKATLPAGVSLTPDGKFNPWDAAYIQEHYKKKHLQIDEEKVAEYFPMDYTIEQLLDIYQQFFSLTLKEVPAPKLWHPDVKLVEVFRKVLPGAKNKSEEFLGYLLLDLHPRPNKYSHACQIGIVPTLRDKDGKRTPGVVVVIANFPHATPTKPALLKYKDVTTFFHEFGHAIHSLLGATELSSFSGTNVKRDFVEMPSQMLEEWLYDPKILKKVSKHYKTGQPLPDDIIKKLIELKKFDSGNHVQRQGYLATFSLELYKDGADKDIYALYKKLYEQIRKHSGFDEATHFYTSFGHLTGYGAKYYGYLWSKVFALDLFEKIKKQGLLNPEIGAEYEAKVLGRGGSVDPNVLLKDFLGREPNQQAFLRDMGFE